MTLKHFVVILIILCVKNSEEIDVPCDHDFYRGRSIVAIDEEKNYFEYHCNISEFVTRVKLVDFGGNQFPNEVFEKFKLLEEIILEIKNQFSVVNENFFTGNIQNKISSLQFFPTWGYEQNHIEKVKVDFFFDKFPGVNYLNIHKFNFGTIEKFKFNEKLTNLNLYLNKIKKLAKNSFSNLKNLEYLNLYDNEIEILHENLLSKNLKLKQFYFSGNQVKEIPRKFFWGITELHWIDFSNNQLEFLHADLLKDNHKLTHIYFSYNKIQKISPHFLTNPKNLVTEQFKKNPCTGEFSKNLTFCFSQWTDSVNSIENDSHNCAKKHASGHMYGGKIYQRSKYPWAVVIICQQTLTCGGSLISKKHILTAAHCFHSKKAKKAIDPSKCYSFLGKNDLTVWESGALNKSISRIILHPSWNADSIHWDADLAIAFLKSPISYTENFLPLCLNERIKSEFYGKTATVIGWGLTNDESESEDQILELDVNVVSPQICYSTDLELVKYVLNDASVICAGNRNRTGACDGDSGGSLFIVDEDDGMYYCIGLVSFGSPIKDGNHTCNTTKFQMYVNVVNYLEWIKHIVFSTY